MHNILKYRICQIQEILFKFLFYFWWQGKFLEKSKMIEEKQRQKQNKSLVTRVRRFSRTLAAAKPS